MDKAKHFFLQNIPKSRLDLISKLKAYELCFYSA